MKTLVIMRHALAQRGGRDFERALDQRGREQACLQAARLKEAVGAIDVAVTSGAVRTKQTLEALRSGGLNVGRDVEVPELYSGSWRESLAQLRTLDANAESVLVIGHEPTVSVMTAMLARDTSPSGDGLGFGFSAAQFVWGEVASWDGLDTNTYEVCGMSRPSL